MSKPKPKKPLFGGKRHPGFLKGYDVQRHIGAPGGGFVKVHARLGKLMNDQLMEDAPEYVRRALDLKFGATWGNAVVKAAVISACEGDTSALTFCLNCSESVRQKAKVSISISADELNQAVHAVRNLPMLMEGEFVDVD